MLIERDVVILCLFLFFIKAIAEGEPVEKKTNPEIHVEVEERDKVPSTEDVGIKIPFRENIKVDGDLSEWQDSEWITLDKSSQYVGNNWNGPQDLSVSIAFARNEKYLFLAARVTDDKFFQDKSGELIWQGDSIQVAIDPLLDRAKGYYAVDDIEFGLALTSKGPETFMWKRYGNEGPSPIPGAEVVIKQDKDKNETIYEASIPWDALLPQPISFMNYCGMTFLVNDNDGEGRKGYLEFTPGIGASKDPSSYKIAYLEKIPDTKLPDISIALYGFYRTVDREKATWKLSGEVLCRKKVQKCKLKICDEKGKEIVAPFNFGLPIGHSRYNVTLTYKPRDILHGTFRGYLVFLANNKIIYKLPFTAVQYYNSDTKKLIQFGWDRPSPEFVRNNISSMEKMPFDGIVIRLQGGWGASPAHIFRKSIAKQEEYKDDINNLKETKFNRFRENFILVWGSREKDWDWFDENDWRCTEENIRLIVSIAKACGMRGICFDPEAYGENPWYYRSLPNSNRKSFEDYWDRVRECGARFMKVIQSEFPDIRILTLFQISFLGHIYLGHVVDITDPKERMYRLSGEHYGLLPAFLNGMLDAANQQVVIIDGNELAYYYRDPYEYLAAYHLTRQRALCLIAPENREKYATRVQVGFPLFMDFYFGTIPPEYEWGRLSHYLTPQERARWFEHNVYYALSTTDEYVWCYNERIDWWGVQKGTSWENFIPDGAVDAILSAKAKLSRGEPLGFRINEMLASAEEKMKGAKK